MNVVFRVDASLAIGSGHVMRCITLAQRMRNCGFKCHFICREHTGNFIRYIEQLGFLVHRLPASSSSQPRVNNEYPLPLHAQWLGSSWELDKQLTSEILNMLGSVGWLIIDHYAIDARWERALKDYCDRILVIDDLADRQHYCDLLIDQTLDRTFYDYKNLVPGETKLLVGPKYALLRDSFVLAREQAYSINAPNNLSRILVSMGGVDEKNATLKVLQQLVKNEKYLVTVLLGPNAPHYKDVSAYCRKYRNIKHIQFTNDIAALMLESDISIGAAGSTSWERACLGLPSIVIPLADNQREIAQKLDVAKAAILIELDDIDSSLAKKIAEIAVRWESIHDANFRLCDGLGVNRLMQELSKLECPSKLKYELVPARHADIQKVFDWQSSSLTRQYALNSEMPSWSAHQNWMQEKLSQTKDYFYIISETKNNIKLGVVRLDWLSKGYYLVSIYVDPENYGLGIAAEALANLDHLHPHVTIEAVVLKENKASQRLFEKANYQRLTGEKFIRGPIV